MQNEEGQIMFVVGIKLKAGVTPHHLQSFLEKKWVPELSRSTRIGSLTSMTLYGVNQNPQTEFVLTIDGFMQGPPTFDLEQLCDIVYSLYGNEMGKWPESSTTAA
jgi:hypothetical protein